MRVATNQERLTLNDAISKERQKSVRLELVLQQANCNHASIVQQLGRSLELKDKEKQNIISNYEAQIQTERIEASKEQEERDIVKYQAERTDVETSANLKLVALNLARKSVRSRKRIARMPPFWNNSTS